MQRIQQGTFKPLKVNILISMRWVVSAMFNEPISYPSMAVVAPSYHKTTFEYYCYTQHTLVFPVLWCNYQYPLFPEFGQRVCPTVCDLLFNPLRPWLWLKEQVKTCKSICLWCTFIPSHLCIDISTKLLPVHCHWRPHLWQCHWAAPEHNRPFTPFWHYAFLDMWVSG